MQKDVFFNIGNGSSKRTLKLIEIIIQMFQKIDQFYVNIRDLSVGITEIPVKFKFCKKCNFENWTDISVIFTELFVVFTGNQYYVSWIKASFEESSRSFSQ